MLTSLSTQAIPPKNHACDLIVAPDECAKMHCGTIFLRRTQVDDCVIAGTLTI